MYASCLCAFVQNHMLRIIQVQNWHFVQCSRHNTEIHLWFVLWDVGQEIVGSHCQFTSVCEALSLTPLLKLFINSSTYCPRKNKEHRPTCGMIVAVPHDTKD